MRSATEMHENNPERLAFEAWIRTERTFKDGALLRNPDGDYYSMRADIAWRAWRRRADATHMPHPMRVGG